MLYNYAMEFPGVDREYEARPETAIHKPVSELLQDPAEVTQLWPEYSLEEQIEQHRADVALVHSVIDSLPTPTTSIEQAVAGGHLSDGEATSLFNTLSRTLDSPDHQRLVLYLPFEFLPNASWQPENIILQGSIVRFTNSYLQAWHTLLNQHDVRANFVDGDVLEEEYRTGDLPRVVKAAHLIPELVNRGMISEEYVGELLQVPDPVLRQSINEALGDLYGVQTHFGTQTTESTDTISDGRQKWLEQLEQERAINETADHIAQASLSEDDQYSLVETLLMLSDSESACQAFVEGTFRAVVSADPEKAERIMSYRQPLMEIMWGSTNEKVKDRVASTYRRLHRAGIVPLEQLTRLGISLPNLAGPFSENMSEISTDITLLKQATEIIENHPQLRSVLYPVVVVGGSKLKGYGKRDSDVDVSVFIKPRTLPLTQAYIRKELDEIFVKDGVRYEPMEFWLDQTKNNQLTVHDFAEPDLHTADSLWTHILFGGAWVGNEQVIKELQQKLLPSYFHSSPETIHGINKRQLYLQRLEQDVLQYRLLHKGYERHFPLITTDRTTDKSAFWDPGYRQLATKLFMSNVFLPKA